MNHPVRIAMAALLIRAALLVAGENAPALSISTFGGFSLTEIKADSASEAFLFPVRGVKSDNLPAGGLEIDWRLNRVLSLSGGLHYRRIRRTSGPAKVELRDNWYPHSFSSSYDLSYIVAPVLLKCGFTAGNHWGALRIGPAPAYCASCEYAWIIDGNAIEQGPYAPGAQFDSYDVRLMAGLEYGVRFGALGLHIGANWEHGIHDILEDTAGDAYTRTLTLGGGLRWFAVAP
jgi:hypothetical protein